VELGADLYVVERWIRLVDELETVYPVFKRDRIVDGSMGQPTLNPLAKYIQDLQGQLARLEAQLGIGPMSRLRLGLTLAEGRMTADKLNEQLDAAEQDEPETEPQDERAAIEAEWTVASS
jgi:P27 family predicted phage terminase small subunit